MNKNKLWKEKTKLENKDKFMIVWHIVMAIFSIVVAIIEKDFTWMLVALLWINVTVMEYCNAKMLKGKDLIIELQEEHIETIKKLNVPKSKLYQRITKLMEKENELKNIRPEDETDTEYNDRNYNIPASICTLKEILKENGEDID